MRTHTHLAHGLGYPRLACTLALQKQEQGAITWIPEEVTCEECIELMTAANVTTRLLMPDSSKQPGTYRWYDITQKDAPLPFRQMHSDTGDRWIVTERSIPMAPRTYQPETKPASRVQRITGSVRRLLGRFL